MPGSVEDCVRSHIAWITLGARAGGGAVGRDGTVDWAWVPGSHTLHVLFPVGPSPDDVRTIVDRADSIGATATAIWSAVDRRRRWLGQLGFERGWQPWWMTADCRDVPPSPRGRVALVDRARDHDAGQSALVGRPDVLLAEASEEGRYAGRAWLHLDGSVAGIYDMAVWPAFRRRGLGREIVGTLVAEAARRGAEVVTLNATPEGAALYGTIGFARVGEGRTWWRHHRPDLQSRRGSRGA